MTSDARRPAARDNDAALRTEKLLKQLASANVAKKKEKNQLETEAGNLRRAGHRLQLMNATSEHHRPRVHSLRHLLCGNRFANNIEIVCESTKEVLLF